MTTHSLEAQLAESNRLLALAEDTIIGLRCGIETPSMRKEGVYSQEKDRAGLRAELYGKDACRDSGMIVWHEVSPTHTLLAWFCC